MILVWTTPLLLTLDKISAGVSLALVLLLAPCCGVGWWRLLKIAWPLLIIAPLMGVSMLLYGAEGGEVYFTFGPATISQNSVTLALAVTIRVLALALPVMVLSRDIDPTELGDGLAQVLHLPARFVIGAVAGLRMATLFRSDWKALARARRARGIADQGRVRYLATMSFGLLVVALRRGGRLATAMEARGFGRASLRPDGKRTWARESTMGTRDWVALAFTAALAAVPVAVAVALGSWRFFGL